jgi:Winged helix DNA-binding domain
VFTVPDRLTLRALNRATLARQLLLDRAPGPAGPVIEHLAGLQAQAPRAPYLGLQARIAGFRPAELEDLLTERTVLRAHLMRNTVHLVAAGDYLSFRPLFQPLMERGLAGNFGRNLTGVDLAELRQAATALLAGRPLTRPELAAQLAPRWPAHHPASLAYAATHLLPVVQVPPRGLWTQSGQAAFFLADAWLVPAPPAPSTASPAAPVEQLVLRYLAAYGPASVADIQAWSGLSRLREVTERLDLRAFAGPEGGPLLDLPGAPRPPQDVPAPPRFLPEYDNLLLSFADRSRVIPHRRPVPLPPGSGASTGTLLIDGQWQANWKIAKDQAVLHIEPFVRLPSAQADAVVAEGRRLLDFTVPGANHEVRFAPVS